MSKHQQPDTRSPAEIRHGAIEANRIAAQQRDERRASLLPRHETMRARAIAMGRQADLIEQHADFLRIVYRLDFSGQRAGDAMLDAFDLLEDYSRRLHSAAHYSRGFWACRSTAACRNDPALQAEALADCCECMAALKLVSEALAWYAEHNGWAVIAKRVRHKQSEAQAEFVAIVGSGLYARKPLHSTVQAAVSAVARELERAYEGVLCAGWGYGLEVMQEGIVLRLARDAKACVFDEAVDDYLAPAQHAERDAERIAAHLNLSGQAQQDRLREIEDRYTAQACEAMNVQRNAEKLTAL